MVLALAVVILAGTVLAGLLLFTQTSLRGASSYRSRTDRLQQSEDALSFASASLRRPRGLSALPDGNTQPRGGLLGLAGESVTRAYRTSTVTCVGRAGSGQVEDGGSYADRTVDCTVADEHGTVLEATILFVDDRGTNLGSSSRVIDIRVRT